MPLSPNDFHVLLVLAGGDLYGYAILKAMEKESGGEVRPEIGSLYRALARLMTLDYVAEVPDPQKSTTGQRGQPRRYYRLTSLGRRTLKADAARLHQALDIARERSLLPADSTT